MKENGNRGPKLVANRPEASLSQVLDVDEIKKGDRFIAMGENKAVLTFKATSNPSQDKDSNWWVDANVDVWLQPGEKSNIKVTHQRISLADCGVVPYSPSHFWNPVNRLLRA